MSRSARKLYPLLIIAIVGIALGGMACGDINNIDRSEETDGGT